MNDHRERKNEMNYATLYGEQVQHQTCGRLGCENDSIAFWQSRMTAGGKAAEPIALIDLHDFAARMRKSWPK